MNCPRQNVGILALVAQGCSMEILLLLLGIVAGILIGYLPFRHLIAYRKYYTQDPVYYDIALDFDGVIHEYAHGLQDGSIYGPLSKGCLDFLNALEKKGFRAVVYSCRDPKEIEDWLAKQGIIHLPVKLSKPYASLYLDDKALRFKSFTNPDDIVEILDHIQPAEFTRSNYGQTHLGR